MESNIIFMFGFLLVCALVWILMRERRYRAREEEFANISNEWLAHEQELLGHIQKMRRELMQEYKAQESLMRQLTELHAWCGTTLKHQSQQNDPAS